MSERKKKTKFSGPRGTFFFLFSFLKGKLAIRELLAELLLWPTKRKKNFKLNGLLFYFSPVTISSLGIIIIFTFVISILYVCYFNDWLHLCICVYSFNKKRARKKDQIFLRKRFLFKLTEYNLERK